MQVRLEVSHKSGKKRTVNIHSDAVIGRSTDCSLRIASSEISRKHCKLTVIESGVLVRDLESANGTWVDGVMIPPNRDVALPPGSRLSIGPVQFVVHYESSNPNIEPPGSTIEMPVMRALPDSDEIPSADEEAADILPVEDSQPPDDVADAVATVVVDPAAVQQALAESFANDEPEINPEPGSAVEVEASEVETTEVAAMVDDATPEVAEPTDAEPTDTEPTNKGKLGSMFGGLLKFGRTSKDKPAKDESPATDADTADDVPATSEADSEPAVDEEQLDVGAVAETDAEYATDTEEGEYTDDEELDEEYEDEYEDEEEVDAELGDFFNQFEE
ncbi:MAG: FHA domain-containing protein [Planctomycetaceae bacterium]|jgi:predicted component of type VI protein secretion system|nr:FHA domain-containing protein [Planctomycetaceae bacterium]MBT6155905.1 FHA domain-containing protein [Planctomycetaceae bacterium]MBT6483180.1 FHA domain-containing protein [Planctomycetaceae bacterium]MBT6495184.1 FHA domain-containing protein [Planctomycetaceae bacterium]